MTRHTLQPPRARLPRNRRPGYTLVEVLISSVSASILMAGLASALFLAGRALEGGSAAAERSRAADAQSTLLTDLEHATSFSERADHAVTFSVPDRNGDGTAETLRYAWSGANGGELTLSVNGGTPAPVLTGVKSFRLNWFTRDIQPEHAAPPALDPASWGNRW